jgi:transposase
MNEHRKTRRRHSAEFKSQVVQACSAPGASTAGVALAFGVNANLVRQWRKGRGFRPTGDELARPAWMGTTVTAPPAPSFVPLALPVAQPQAAPPADIRLEVRRGALAVNVMWPVSAAADCATWLREWLR